jgi:hypothetical protein
MPESAAVERSAECESLAMKVHTYVNEASVHGRSTRLDLHGLPEYAAELAKHGDRTTLLGLAREVDRWLRDVHQPSDALLLVAKMRSRGVRDSELPVLAAARRLETVTKRGSICSESEAELVQSTLANAELAKLLGARAVELGIVLAKWHKSRACS